MPTNHLIIHGEVQGVFFRATAKKVADKLGITGWVKNTDDGNVEIMATGSDTALHEFLNWCRQGPEKAEVENITIEQVEEKPFRDFEIIRRR